MSASATATKTPTPQLSALATGVILNPWWEVPKSIEGEVRGTKGYVAVTGKDGKVRRVTVDMGTPILDLDEIPVDRDKVVQGGREHDTVPRASLRPPAHMRLRSDDDIRLLYTGTCKP